MMFPSSVGTITFILVFLTKFYDARTEPRIIVDTRVDTLPEVETSLGTVRGFFLTTHHARNISAFRGIPYGEPPVDDLRFANPVAKGNWSGIWNASTDGTLCTQISDGEIIGGEDCLYLNVYTPQIPGDEGTSSDLLPVMFWVPGGAFDSGGGASKWVSGEYLLDEDIVLVTINYRLGPMGFLSTGDEVSPGNWGLKDQVLALEWVRDNIEYFGGDPDQVTLFGQSAGGASVHLLTLSDTTRGLYSRYIAQSGTALGPWAYSPRSLCASLAYKLGELVDCTSDNSEDLIACLRSRNASYLIGTKPNFLVWGSLPSVTWGPTDEVEGDGSFLTASPGDIIDQGKIPDVPGIIGFTRDDGALFSLASFVASETFEDFLANIDEILPYALFYKNRVDDEESFTSAIKEYYLNDPTVERDLIFANVTKMLTDALFVHGAYALSQKYEEIGSQPHYVYSFEYRGTFSYSSQITTGNYGAVHCDELLYLFPQIDYTFPTYNVTMTENDLSMLDTMVGAWTSFVAGRTPTINSSRTVKNDVTWEPYSTDCRHLLIGNDSDPSLFFDKSIFEDRVAFWTQLTKSEESSSDTVLPMISLIVVLLVYLCSRY